MTSDLALTRRCQDLVVELGLGDPRQIEGVTALTGGVASDIAKFDLGSKTYCAKFALDKLRVAEDWRVPVHRNRAEYEWLLFAGTIDRDCVPQLYGHSDTMNGFVMEYISGDGVYLWKTALLKEASKGEESGKVADLLGLIHSASTEAGFCRRPFENREDFFAIRLEPYLVFTAALHPPLANRLMALAEEFDRTQIALVHGDVSPKNILLNDGQPVFLDAECATIGDPAFDVAFCINHLVIKAVHIRQSGRKLLDAVKAFWKAYRPHVRWENDRATESRVSRLLPALMLARVDGKSPVEYLAETERRKLRTVAIALLTDSHDNLSSIIDYLQAELK